MQTFTQYLVLQESKNLYSYSSVLFLLPDDLAEEVHKWGLKHVKDKDLYLDPEEDRSYGREDEMHCTVLYGIHDKKATATKKVLKNEKPFEISLGKVSMFTNPEKFDVLKVEVIGKKLHTLHNLLRDNLEVTESYPEYKPHITIAYLKKGKCKSLVGSDEFLGTKAKVDKVVFSSRSGIKTPISFSS